MSTPLSHNLRYFGSHLYPTIHFFFCTVFHFTPGWFFIDFLSVVQMDFIVMILDIDVSATVLVPREAESTQHVFLFFVNFLFMFSFSFLPKPPNLSSHLPSHKNLTITHMLSPTHSFTHPLTHPPTHSQMTGFILFTGLNKLLRVLKLFKILRIFTVNQVRAHVHIRIRIRNEHTNK